MNTRHFLARLWRLCLPCCYVHAFHGRPRKSNTKQARPTPAKPCAPSELSKWPSPPPNTNHSRWLSSGRLKFAGIGDFYDQSEYRFSTDRPQFGMPDYEAFHVPVHNCCVIPTDMCTIPPFQLARPSASLPRKISLFNCAPASKMVSLPPSLFVHRAAAAAPPRPITLSVSFDQRAKPRARTPLATAATWTDCQSGHFCHRYTGGLFPLLKIHLFGA